MRRNNRFRLDRFEEASALLHHYIPPFYGRATISQMFVVLFLEEM